MEQKFIGWLEQYLSESSTDVSASSNVVLGVGDDGAVLDRCDQRRVIVADSIVDKVHFDLQQHDLASVGHKALAVNLSDIAAMGAIPEAAVITLTLPRSTTFEDAKRLFAGVAETANEFGVTIVGGDTSRHEGALMVSISVTGLIDPSFHCPLGWRMDGAQPDDLLVVTGPLGGSIAGKHLDFEPALGVAKAIQMRAKLNAATDISDSLAIDLSHVLRKSNVGAKLNFDDVPVSTAAKKLSASSGKSQLEHALYDGEDFELLLSIKPSQFEILETDPDFNFPLHRIGRITVDHPGKIVESGSGKYVEVRGYEH